MPTILNLAPSMPDQEVAFSHNPDQTASRAHDGAEARKRLAAKLAGADTSVTNRMRSLVRANNDTNARAFAAGATPDLPGLEELVDSMKMYQMQVSFCTSCAAARSTTEVADSSRMVHHCADDADDGREGQQPEGGQEAD